MFFVFFVTLSIFPAIQAGKYIFYCISSFFSFLFFLNFKFNIYTIQHNLLNTATNILKIDSEFLTNLKEILKKKQCNCLIMLEIFFYIFLRTLKSFKTCFPTFAGVKRSDENFFISENYYMAITCFLTFNLWAMLGSLLSGYVKWPKPKYLWVPVTLRVLYVPFFLLCNYQVPSVQRILPVLISNDWVYWITAITMGFTSGYFSSLAMMYTPK